MEMTEYGKHGKPRSRQRHHPPFGPTRIAYLRILDFPWRTANPRKRFTRRIRWRGGDCEPQNSLLPNRWRNHSTSCAVCSPGSVIVSVGVPPSLLASRPAQARVATAITSVILPWKLRHSHTCRHGQRATILVWSQALPFWL